MWLKKEELKSVYQANMSLFVLKFFAEICRSNEPQDWFRGVIIYLADR